MDILQVREFALSLPGATEDMPYGPDWLVFRVAGKIFLHIWLEAPSPTCAVKLPPEQGQQLRAHHAGSITAAYHLNKVHWNDLYLQQLDDELVEQCITTSHHLVCSRLPLRLRPS